MRSETACKYVCLSLLERLEATDKHNYQHCCPPGSGIADWHLENKEWFAKAQKVFGEESAMEVRRQDALKKLTLEDRYALGLDDEDDDDLEEGPSSQLSEEGRARLLNVIFSGSTETI